MSCAGQSDADVTEITIPNAQLPPPSPPITETPANPRPQVTGIADQIRFSVETGSPSALMEALNIIRSRELGSSDYGRAMNAVSVAFMKNLYPDIKTELPMSDPPQTHNYTRIMREAQAGIYAAPDAQSADYIEYVLPFLAFIHESAASLYSHFF